MLGDLDKGLKLSAGTLSKKYRSSAGIEEMKRKGFSDEMIKALQEEADSSVK